MVRTLFFALLGAAGLSILASAPACGETLPVNQPLVIRNEATNKLLQVDPVAGVRGERNVQLAAGLNTQQTSWFLVPIPGRPGRVAIELNAPATAGAPAITGLLDVNPPAGGGDRATVKLARFTAVPSFSQQWRITEITGGGGRPGPFVLENVEYGLVLDADVAAQNNAITAVQALGRNGATNPNRQWRFILPRPLTAAIPNDSLPANGKFILPTLTNGAGNFQRMGPNVTVTATILGDGTNELSIRVTMTATATGGDGTTITGTQNFPIVRVAPGRKLFLPPAGFVPRTETCTYTQTAGGDDFCSPPPQNYLGKAPPPPPAANSPPGIIWYCQCTGDVGGPALGKTGVRVFLKPIVYFTEASRLP
jgi:hypothetical protein